MHELARFRKGENIAPEQRAAADAPRSHIPRAMLAEGGALAITASHAWQSMDARLRAEVMAVVAAGGVPVAMLGLLDTLAQTFAVEGADMGLDAAGARFGDAFTVPLALVDLQDEALAKTARSVQGPALRIAFQCGRWRILAHAAAAYRGISSQSYTTRRGDRQLYWRLPSTSQMRSPRVVPPLLTWASALADDVATRSHSASRRACP